MELWLDHREYTFKIASYGSGSGKFTMHGFLDINGCKDIDSYPRRDRF
jgi:hypothetical protein